jgi:hypothetical protein
MREEKDLGYVIAKLESMSARLDVISEQQVLRGAALDALSAQIRDYTSQWRAVRMIGAAALALLIFFKTGDTAAVRALFGGG